MPPSRNCRARGHANERAGGHGGYGSSVLYGGHVSSSGGIHTAIDRAEGIGGDAAQIFTQSPRMWRPTNHKPESIESPAPSGDPIRPLSCALSGQSCARALCEWKLHSGRPSTSLARSTRTLSYTSARTWAPASTPACSGPCLVPPACARTHLGNHVAPPRELGGRRRNHRSLRGRASDDSSERVGPHPRLGICLDSCHLWVSGVDVTDPETVSALLDEVDRASAATGSGPFT